MASRKDWDPRKWPHRFRALERLASETIGDGKSPNLYFVTVEGKVVLVTQDFHSAKVTWEMYAEPLEIETSMEDRKVGVLASVEPDEHDAGNLARIVNFDLLAEEDR